MAAPRLLQMPRILPHFRLLQTPRTLPLVGWRDSRHSSSSSLPSIKHRILHSLNNYYHDIETVLEWSSRFKTWNLRRKNAHYAYTERLYGPYAAAAYYALSKKGGVKFKGHIDWHRADRKGRFSWDFMQYKDVPLEGIDLSNSPLTFRGLDNIVSLTELRELYLRNCPHLNDWALSRLHVFKDSLEVLSLAGCPHITERGLATLHHLQNLQHLDLSNLPSVPNKGLIKILLEEILPGCQIVGLDYFDGLEDTEGQPLLIPELRH
ncbi:ATP synthase subunit s [Pelobates cultripes]|uniref:Distal membrane-arm assembly complex protein 2 n=1 Tax=Pelobates cultripes TaxID=61616 RepID=A0AAD1T036_PELCU|nr:ATP synthase subunit s [Pelobates cultripes]